MQVRINFEWQSWYNIETVFLEPARIGWNERELNKVSVLLENMMHFSVLYIMLYLEWVYFIVFLPRIEIPEVFRRLNLAKLSSIE